MKMPTEDAFDRDLAAAKLLNDAAFSLAFDTIPELRRIADVEAVSHDPESPERYQALIKTYLDALDAYSTLHHAAAHVLGVTFGR